tara:strand:+ start:239 stop:976 length:738 start_codon:yes stop_codon:yes gene_type:complete
MTFTMLGRCERTGEIGLSSATTSLAVGARLGQRFRAADREWIIASQAVARPGLGWEAGDLLAGGLSFDALESELAKLDSDLSWRQLGILGSDGTSWVYTGGDNHDWKGHATTDGAVALGNMLAGEATVSGMVATFDANPDASLAERLLCAIEGGRDAGGQADENGSHQPELSAFVRVFKTDGDVYIYGSYGRTPVLDLRVDHDPDAVTALRRIFEAARPLREAYEQRARAPLAYLRDSGDWETEA